MKTGRHHFPARRLVPFALLSIACVAGTARPAAAQIFWQPPVFESGPITPGTPDSQLNLPGATVAEERAALAWHMRSALNVAALQCQGFPLATTADNYNAILTNHKDELAAAYAQLTGYFKRKAKTAAAGQKALDSYGTKTYISYSTVQGFLGFCDTAGKIGKELMFARRGTFTDASLARLHELRSSLIRASEGQFRFQRPFKQYVYPDFTNESCWKRNNYTNRCPSVVMNPA